MLGKIIIVRFVEEREFSRARIPPSTFLSSDFKIQGVAVAASCKFPSSFENIFLDENGENIYPD